MNDKINSSGFLQVGNNFFPFSAIRKVEKFSFYRRLERHAGACGETVIDCLTKQTGLKIVTDTQIIKVMENCDHVLKQLRLHTGERT